jgi:hypothetical protein
VAASASEPLEERIKWPRKPVALWSYHYHVRGRQRGAVELPKIAALNESQVATVVRSIQSECGLVGFEAPNMELRAGDWVEVRSKEEILATLDENGRLENLPFMPQMFKYCGQRFQVFKRAHKTCDVMDGRYVARSLSDGVHLSLRCDGKAYGGCQAGCLIFWKTAWLRTLDDGANSKGTATIEHRRSQAVVDSGCTGEAVLRATKQSRPGCQTRYFCQATELLNSTTPLKWWDARQYVETYRSGNASLSQILRGLFYLAYLCGTLANRQGIGRPARWFYDRFQMLWGGLPFPDRKGHIPIGEPPPSCDLDLRPGDLVRVKSYKEILTTLDTAGFNRGLSFAADLTPYCGKVYRVKIRVENFIDERTGRMRRLRTPAVILEGVYCTSQFSGQRMFCSRSIYSWWREIWLERVYESSAEDQEEDVKQCHPASGIFLTNGQLIDSRSP